MISPVLFLIFNRPDTTARVFETIRAARPARLYVAADGPRRGREGEAERCAEARRIATAVDWPCELKTLFQETNLGCRAAPNRAINWFFEHEEEGIILEDDCLPDPSFFFYCTELLAHYRDTAEVMTITGNNFQRDMKGYPHSYYFSIYHHSWGWATWRRAWRLNDQDMLHYGKFLEAGILKSKSSVPNFEAYWKRCLEEVSQGTLDAWDYVWTYSCWANNGVTCTPRVNLVSNIGFGRGATHTLDSESLMANIPAQPLERELVHPPAIEVCTSFDDNVARDVYGIKPHLGPIDRARRHLSRLLQRDGRRL